jgi:uncharacterized protein
VTPPADSIGAEPHRHDPYPNDPYPNDPYPNDIASVAVAFTRVLRGVGIDVPISSTLSFREALTVTGIDDRDTVYWAGHTTLIRRPEDRDLYDRAFKVFWEARTGSGASAPPEEPLHITLAVDDGRRRRGVPRRVRGRRRPHVLELRFSATEVLRQKDFADYSDDELVEAHALMERFRLVGSPRRSLRLTPSRSRTSRPDLRRTVRATIEPVESPGVATGVSPGPATGDWCCCST